MRRTLAPWKIAALASSLTLATAFVAYAVTTFAPRRADVPPSEPSSSGTATEVAPAEATPAEEDVYFPSSKSMIGVGGRSGGAFKGRPKPPEVPAPPPPEVYLGGSKSMPFPEPPGDELPGK